MVRFDLAGSIVDARRLLDNTQPQLRGRPHAVGDLAVVRGGGQRSRLRGRPVRRAAAQGPQRHGPVPARGRGGRRGPADRLPDRRTRPSGLFYRYRYAQPNDLSSGVLEAARVDAGAVSWLPVPDPTGTPTADPLAGARGDALRRRGGHLVRPRRRQLRHQVRRQGLGLRRRRRAHLSVVYDWTTNRDPVLRGVDNIAVRNGDIFVCEDMGILGFPDDPEICVIEPDGLVSVFVRAVGHRTERADRPRLQPGRRPPLLLVAAGDRRPRASRSRSTGPFPA